MPRWRAANEARLRSFCDRKASTALMSPVGGQVSRNGEWRALLPRSQVVSQSWTPRNVNCSRRRRRLPSLSENWRSRRRSSSFRKNARSAGIGASGSWRARRVAVIAIVEQRDASVIPLDTACGALGVSRASLYRERQPVYDTCKPAPSRAPNPRRLPDAERREILDTLHLPEFVDQPPAGVYATLLGRGQYLGSIRTLYRVLAESGETRERRNKRPPHAYAKPSLTATGLN